MAKIGQLNKNIPRKKQDEKVSSQPPGIIITCTSDGEFYSPVFLDPDPKTRETRIVEHVERHNKPTLALACSQIDADVLGSISKALTSKPALTRLDLSKNNLGNEGAKIISKILYSGSALLSLDLEENGISELGARDIGGALNSNSVLRALSLCGNPLGDKGGEEISDGLKNNWSLTDLELGDCNIRTRGASEILRALKDNLTLTSLSLSFNPINNDGAVEIASALKTNHSLTSLDLRGCRIGDVGAAAIFKALGRNNTLTKLQLCYNEDIQDEENPKLLKELEENITLVYIDLYNAPWTAIPIINYNVNLIVKLAGFLKEKFDTNKALQFTAAEYPIIAFYQKANPELLDKHLKNMKVDPVAIRSKIDDYISKNYLELAAATDIDQLGLPDVIVSLIAGYFNNRLYEVIDPATLPGSSDLMSLLNTALGLPHAVAEEADQSGFSLSGLTIDEE